MIEHRQQTRPALPSNFMAQFIRGMSYPIEGLRFIGRHKLWPMASVSIAVNVIVLAALLFLTFYWMLPRVDSLSQWMHTEAAGSSWLLAIVWLATWLLWLVAVPAAIAVNFIVLVLVGQAVAAPFLDILSEKVEAILMGHAAKSGGVKQIIRSLWLGISDLFWGLLLLIAVNVPVLLVGLLPGIGAGIGGLISFCFTACLLTHEFVGLALARHLVSYRNRWRMVRRNIWISLGFGTVVMWLLLVPVLNLLLLPLSAVGGTLLYIDLHRAGRLTP